MFYFCDVKKMLLILSLLVFIKPVVPVFEYVINYEYIAKVLCINKDKPEMQCNGKCHLMQELAKTSEKELPLTPTKKHVVTETEVLFYQELESFAFDCFFNESTLHITSNYVNFYQLLKSSGTFHPPCFII